MLHVSYFIRLEMDEHEWIDTYSMCKQYIRESCSVNFDFFSLIVSLVQTNEEIESYA